jgi:hypothetical protein
LPPTALGSETSFTLASTLMAIFAILVSRPINPRSDIVPAASPCPFSAAAAPGASRAREGDVISTETASMGPASFTAISPGKFSGR